MEMEGAFNKVDTADMLEKKIGFSLPSNYKDFLRQHPDGAIYYPKVIQKGKEFFSFCDPTKDVGDDERWLREPDDGIIGQVEIKLFKASETYSDIPESDGSWKMKCVCIGGMNDDRLLILDCLTEDIYCLEHDELLFRFDSQEDYDKKMPTKAVCFPDFTSLLDWCTGGWIYDPIESSRPYAEKWKQRQNNYPKNVIYL
jgi:hypothetical protein|nr:SMI1/KNR4 family protein [uncultured Akkermansia sp.]